MQLNVCELRNWILFCSKFRISFFVSNFLYLISFFFFILRRCIFSHLFLQKSFFWFIIVRFSLYLVLEIWSRWSSYSHLFFLGFDLWFHLVDLLKLLINVRLFNLFVRWTIFSTFFQSFLSWLSIFVKFIGNGWSFQMSFFILLFFLFESLLRMFLIKVNGIFGIKWGSIWIKNLNFSSLSSFSCWGFVCLTYVLRLFFNLLFFKLFFLFFIRKFNWLWSFSLRFVIIFIFFLLSS